LHHSRLSDPGLARRRDPPSVLKTQLIFARRNIIMSEMRNYVKLPPLEVEPELAAALNAYAKQLGVPRARVHREILRGFLGPMAQSARGAELPIPSIGGQDD